MCGVTFLGYFWIELKPSGAQILVPHLDGDEYLGLVAVLKLPLVACQVSVWAT